MTLDPTILAALDAAECVTDGIDRFTEEDGEPGRVDWKELYRRNLALKKCLVLVGAQAAISSVEIGQPTAE